jgi:sulfide:quinone oxidoreductase
MEGSRLRVLIAGGGVAGLETLIALRELAGDRVELTLAAPDDEFVYRPVTIGQPHAVGAARSVALPRAAEESGSTFVAATLETVDADTKAVLTSSGERLPYDALVLAIGAEATPALHHVTTWDDRSDSEVLGGLLRDFEEGYAERLAVVIPRGPGWPLRGYELALMVTLSAYDMSVDVQTTIVQPEPSPLVLLGDRAVSAIGAELERAGIAVVSAEQVSIERDHRTGLVLQPSGERVEVDRVLAMPILRGRTVSGIPADGYGLIPIDAFCHVPDLDRVWAVGDCTSCLLKSGGVSAEQADVVAGGIAAIAGADVEPQSFDPVHALELAGLPAARFIEQRLATQEPGLAMHVPSTGVPVLTYLQRDLAAGWRGATVNNE